ncbi:hypothetical protein OBBRIDRAFT_790189 [Obba rivulosa]|uniref:Sld7 C-terminal domain-containing protein n=1 Tax=Obba rivulosa TaxID=1052685 RepID=A0A8E2J2T3_9APHY|nr:hypothetical protein OBBRIDRAFT_790189 [Obba rivulosa]
MAGNNHRLLYRGALSLPDSHLLLDGLSFTIRVGEVQSGAGIDLLHNPLALALESMRGRSLHLLGTTRLKDVWVDVAGDVSMDIHPKSTLSRIYFENILCLNPIVSPDGRTDEGVRVSLSDSNEPGTNDILIFGQLEAVSSSLPSTSTAPPTTLRILAARILPAPPVPARPRPDDPTPRQPPPLLGSKRKRELSSLAFELGERAKRVANDKGKGRAPQEHEPDIETLRRARDVMLNIPKPGAQKGARESKDTWTAKSRDAVFKVPSLPDRAGSAQGVSSQPAIGRSRSGGTTLGGADTMSALAGELEKANKTIIKKVVVQCLADRGIRKGRDDFNDLYQYIYRGTCFALRARTRSSSLDSSVVEHLVEAHAALYVLEDAINRTVSGSNGI